MWGTASTNESNRAFLIIFLVSQATIILFAFMLFQNLFTQLDAIQNTQSKIYDKIEEIFLQNNETLTAACTDQNENKDAKQLQKMREIIEKLSNKIESLMEEWEMFTGEFMDQILVNFESILENNSNYRECNGEETGGKELEEIKSEESEENEERGGNVVILQQGGEVEKIEIESEVQRGNAVEVEIEHLFENENATTIWKVVYPGINGNFMKQNLHSLSQISHSRDYTERIHLSSGTNKYYLLACGKPNTALPVFQRIMGNITVLDSEPGEYSTFHSKQKLIESTLPSRGPIGSLKGNFTHPITMFRNPLHYLSQVFSTRYPVYSTSPSGKQMSSIGNLQHNSDEFLYYDWTFEHRTNLSLSSLTFSEYIHSAFWRWNYFTRSLLDHHYRSLWLRYLEDDNFTWHEAAALNEIGSPQALKLLSSAKLTLEKSFSFIGVAHRIQESLELFAFTFCISPENLVIPHEKEKLEHVVLSEEEIKTFEMNNRLDTLLFEYIEEIFDLRMKKMRTAKQFGYNCQFTHNSCGLFSL